MDAQNTADAVEQAPEKRWGRLNRELIVDQAVAIIDDSGPAALTMRRLGQDLGAEAMSLYRYVNGREDLLEAVVDRLVGELRVDPGGEMHPMDGWQAFLQWMAHEVRRLALEHPNAFPLIATRHPAAPWLRPPLRSLRVVQEFLDGLTARGFTDAQAVAAYRSFTSFLLGHLLLESATLGASTGPVEEPLNEGEAAVPNGDVDVDLDNYPTVSRLRDQLSEDHTEAEFEKALEALLERMDLALSQ
ncbi:MAG: TetR/AcrR family transcriptional regulator C-terminal domain-containing protein [Knoellia sp.]